MISSCLKVQQSSYPLSEDICFTNFNHRVNVAFGLHVVNVNRSQEARSLIVRPHTQDTNSPLCGEYFVNQSMLDVDAARVSASKVTDQLLKSRWVLQWVDGKNRKQFLRFGLEAASCNLLGIFECLLGKNNIPTHHFSAFALVANGSAMPALMDSRIPGTASKYKVS